MNRTNRSRQKVAQFTKLHYVKGAKPSRFDIFKHLILARTLKLFSQQQTSGYTYIDFSAGPGKVPVSGQSEALQTIYKHAREDHKNKQFNVALPLIECINKINGETERAATLTPPVLGQEPEFYPTGAGFADMYLRPQDRAILTEANRADFQTLKETYGKDKRFKLYEEMLSENLFNTHIPPPNRKGIVYLDVHKGVQSVIENAQKDGQYVTNDQVIGNLKYMADLIANSCRNWPTATYVIPFGTSMSKHYQKIFQPKKKKNHDEDQKEEPEEVKREYREIPVPPANFLDTIRASGVNQMLLVDMYMEDKEEGIGCLIINPPQGLDHELYDKLPILKEKLSFPTDKEVWRRPRVVWPKRADNYFDKEEEERRFKWVYVNRMGMSDEAIEAYENAVDKRWATSPEEYDEYLNRDERREWAELGHENFDMHDLSNGPPGAAVHPELSKAKQNYIADMAATEIGRTGGVVYPKVEATQNDQEVKSNETSS